MERDGLMTVNAVDNGQGTQNAAKVPWDEETFDAERAGRLVTNLKAEVESLKSDVATFKAQAEEAETVKARVAELESENAAYKQTLEEREAELSQMTTRSAKEKILADRGLPLNLVTALSGDEETEWTQMADMLSSLRGSGESGGYLPDPVQQDGDTPGGDSVELQQARALGFM